MEGAFESPFIGLHQVKTVDSYRRSKRALDVDITSPFSRPIEHRSSNLIVLRDTDPHDPAAFQCAVSSSSGGGCSHLDKRDSAYGAAICGTEDIPRPDLASKVSLSSKAPADICLASTRILPMVLAIISLTL